MACAPLEEPERAATPAPQTKTLEVKGILWEITLQSVKWSGSVVTVDVKITNKGNRPAMFGFGPSTGWSWPQNADFAVIDQYGFAGEDITQREWSKEFLCGNIYPHESRTGSLKFQVNPNSGLVKLYVTRYSGMQSVYLFDLGEA